MTPPLKDLAYLLVEECKKSNLHYDPNSLPVKLTADCYIIYATPINNECSKKGNCQVKQYYALTGGQTIRICESNANE